MGLASLDPTDERYGLTFVLGGGEVTPLELAEAYAVFANGGFRIASTPVLRIETPTGQVVWQATPQPKQVLPPHIAAMITDILSDNEAREPAFGRSSPLSFPGRFVAAKTGTTNEFRDAWTIGYSTSVVVAAWVGNNDNTPMRKRVASYLVAPLWHKAMEAALQLYPEEPFPEQPPLPTEVKPVLRGIWWGNESYFVDTISGKLATPFTPAETTEERVVPAIHSILHWVRKDDPLGPPPQDPRSDPQYLYWEAGVQRWKKEYNIHESSFPQKPTTYDDVHIPANKPKVMVLSPKNNSFVSLFKPVTVAATASGTYPIQTMEVYLNDIFVGKDTTPPFSLSFTPCDLLPSQQCQLSSKNEKGIPATIRIRVIDSVWNKTDHTTSLTLSPSQ
jgi:membrane peptidoglycan carboxypeptidase